MCLANYQTQRSGFGERSLRRYRLEEAKASTYRDWPCCRANPFSEYVRLDSCFAYNLISSLTTPQNDALSAASALAARFNSSLNPFPFMGRNLRSLPAPSRGLGNSASPAPAPTPRPVACPSARRRRSGCRRADTSSRRCAARAAWCSPPRVCRWRPCSSRGRRRPLEAQYRCRPTVSSAAKLEASLSKPDRASAGQAALAEAFGAPAPLAVSDMIKALV